jgi:hypothetical protein
MNVETDSTRSPTDDGFPWHYLVYAGPVNMVLSILTIVGIGLYLATEIRFLAILSGVGLIVLILGGFLTLLLVEVGIFFDAPVVAEADVQWSPNRALYMLGALPFSPLVGTVYVLQRREYVR